MKMKKILVSACLLGKNCKYNGLNNKNDFICSLEKDNILIPICPEVQGGLSTPRIPSEIKGDKVINKNGEDVTENYAKGASIALDTALKNNIDFCILKEKSPSCGVHNIYDGNFNKTLIEKSGYTSNLLKKYYKVYSENDIEEIKKEF